MTETLTLINKLPMFDPSWDEETREHWVDAFGGLVRRLYPEPALQDREIHDKPMTCGDLWGMMLEWSRKYADHRRERCHACYQSGPGPVCQKCALCNDSVMGFITWVGDQGDRPCTS